MPRVRLFGHLAQVLGTRTLEIDAATLTALLAALEQRFGADFRDRSGSSRVLLNGATVDPLADGDRPLDPDDEVGFLPPAAGG